MVDDDHDSVPLQAHLVAPVESSLDLIERAKAGERDALEALLTRYLPRIRSWANGRLPRWARDLSDTDDLVQETLLHAFTRIGRFEVRHEGALQAYLRQAVINRIRDELRRVRRRPSVAALDGEPVGSNASPLDVAIGHEAAERYERALSRLRPGEREAIVARVEMGCTNPELALVLDKPTPNAARMAVERALLRLAEEMRRDAQ